MKKARRKLSYERRLEAADALLNVLLPSLTTYETILSFVSLSQEIDTSLLNRFLATTGRLLLPKTAENNLRIYQVTDLKQQLEKGPFNLLEPIVSQCKEVHKEEIEIVLVPALGFDKTKHRLGFGKGYYDRFLASIPNCHTIGIGFKEQLVQALPVESTDIPLKQISLY